MSGVDRTDIARQSTELGGSKDPSEEESLDTVKGKIDGHKVVFQAGGQEVRVSTTKWFGLRKRSHGEILGRAIKKAGENGWSDHQISKLRDVQANEESPSILRACKVAHQMGLVEIDVSKTNIQMLSSLSGVDPDHLSSLHGVMKEIEGSQGVDKVSTFTGVLSFAQLKPGLIPQSALRIALDLGKSALITADTTIHGADGPKLATQLVDARRVQKDIQEDIDHLTGQMGEIDGRIHSKRDELKQAFSWSGRARKLRAEINDLRKELESLSSHKDYLEGLKGNSDELIYVISSTLSKVNDDAVRCLQEIERESSADEKTSITDLRELRSQLDLILEKGRGSRERVLGRVQMTKASTHEKIMRALIGERGARTNFHDTLHREMTDLQEIEEESDPLELANTFRGALPEHLSKLETLKAHVEEEAGRMGSVDSLEVQEGEQGASWTDKEYLTSLESFLVRIEKTIKTTEQAIGSIRENEELVGRSGGWLDTQFAQFDFEGIMELEPENVSAKFDKAFRELGMKPANVLREAESLSRQISERFGGIGEEIPKQGVLQEVEGFQATRDTYLKKLEALQKGCRTLLADEHVSKTDDAMRSRQEHLRACISRVPSIKWVRSALAKINEASDKIERSGRSEEKKAKSRQRLQKVKDKILSDLLSVQFYVRSYKGEELETFSRGVPPKTWEKALRINQKLSGFSTKGASLARDVDAYVARFHEAKALEARLDIGGDLFEAGERKAKIDRVLADHELFSRDSDTVAGVKSLRKDEDESVREFERKARESLQGSSEKLFSLMQRMNGSGLSTEEYIQLGTWVDAIRGDTATVASVCQEALLQQREEAVQFAMGVGRPYTDLMPLEDETPEEVVVEDEVAEKAEGALLEGMVAVELSLSHEKRADLLKFDRAIQQSIDDSSSVIRDYSGMSSTSFEEEEIFISLEQNLSDVEYQKLSKLREDLLPLMKGRHEEGSIDYARNLSVFGRTEEVRQEAKAQLQELEAKKQKIIEEKQEIYRKVAERALSGRVESSLLSQEVERITAGLVRKELNFDESCIEQLSTQRNARKVREHKKRSILVQHMVDQGLEQLKKRESELDPLLCQSIRESIELLSGLVKDPGTMPKDAEAAIQALDSRLAQYGLNESGVTIEQRLKKEAEVPIDQRIRMRSTGKELSTEAMEREFALVSDEVHREIMDRITVKEGSLHGRVNATGGDSRARGGSGTVALLYLGDDFAEAEVEEREESTRPLGEEARKNAVMYMDMRSERRGSGMLRVGGASRDKKAEERQEAERLYEEVRRDAGLSGMFSSRSRVIGKLAEASSKIQGEIHVAHTKKQALHEAIMQSVRGVCEEYGSMVSKEGLTKLINAYKGGDTAGVIAAYQAIQAESREMAEFLKLG